MNAFINVYYPGSGSSWLMNVLGSCRDVWVPGYEPLESWHWPGSPSEKLAWLEAAIRPVTDDDPEFDEWLETIRQSPQAFEPVKIEYTTLGFKMTEKALPSHETLLRALQQAPPKLIFLERDNRFKHALSLYRSYEEKKNQFQFKGLQEASTLDLEVFDGWVETAMEWHERSAALRRLCEQTIGADRVLTISYESFADDTGKPEVLDQVCSFLGVDPTIPAAAIREASAGGEPFGPDGYYRKATSDSVREAVSNLDEVATRYQGTVLADDIAEALQ